MRSHRGGAAFSLPIRAKLGCLLVSVLLGIRFFARRDEFQPSQPVGRKIVAQCVSTGRTTVPPQPRNGAEAPGQRPFFRPVPGLAYAARLLPTALRRGLLSCALRALCAVSSAAFRHVEKSGGLSHQFREQPRGHHLAPFGLCALSRLRLAAMWNKAEAYPTNSARIRAATSLPRSPVSPVGPTHDGQPASQAQEDSRPAVWRSNSGARR